MPKRTTRSRREAPQNQPIEVRLARLLDTPALARIVPQLSPGVLHQIIRHRGLEACLPMVTSATASQLAAVLDVDVWQPPSPGDDEQFDVDRFAEWIELLVDYDAPTAARLVATLDLSLVVASVSRFVRVIDPATIGVAFDDDGPAMRDPRSAELGGYIVIPRRLEAWDAITTLLVALDADQPTCFHALMRGCRDLSHSTPERDGLDELMLASDQLLHDVARARQARRTRQGYVSPADARAFLQLARQGSETISWSADIGTRGGAPANHVAAACLQELAATRSSVDHEPNRADVPPIVSADEEDVARVLLDLLEEAGLTRGRPRALPASGGSEAEPVTHMRRLLSTAREADALAYLRREEELVFLANALAAGCSLLSRPFTAEEATDAAIATCNLALDSWAGSAAAVPDTFLLHRDLVTVFETGWSLLHRDVSLFVADRLRHILAAVPVGDTTTQMGLHALRRELGVQRTAGTPWRALQAFDVLATLDVVAWNGLLGLMDEYPVVPAAVSAVVDRQRGAISPTAFQFISTRRQLDTIRAFLARLPDLLDA
ncbi:MAG: DUF6178 family protein [Vicinamibacterales bacterium]